MLSVKVDKKDTCDTVISSREELSGDFKVCDSEEIFLCCLTSFKAILKIRKK